MCLTTLDGGSIKDNKKRASKDLYTFKVVNRGWHTDDIKSPYMGYKYEYNLLYKSQLKSYVNGHSNEHRYVNVGFHSLYTDNTTWFKTNSKIIYFDKQPLCIVLCKIPKGATYIIGDNGDVVSTQIIIEKPIFISKYNMKEKQERKSIKTVNSLFKQTMNYLNLNYPNNQIKLN